jgi:hypothetical protein
MHKKITIGVALATILIAYISVFSLSDQVFAQPPHEHVFATNIICVTREGFPVRIHINPSQEEARPGLVNGQQSIDHTPNR